MDQPHRTSSSGAEDTTEEPQTHALLAMLQHILQFSNAAAALPYLQVAVPSPLAAIPGAFTHPRHDGLLDFVQQAQGQLQTVSSAAQSPPQTPPSSDSATSEISGTADTLADPTIYPDAVLLANGHFGCPAPACTCKYKHKRDYSRHYKEVHTELPDLRCSCGRTFKRTRPYQLKNHLQASPGHQAKNGMLCP